MSWRLFSPESLISIALVLVFTKLNLKYSFSHYILKGLTFWIPPSDQTIAEISPSSTFEEKEKESVRKRKNKDKPASQQISLELAEIRDGYLRDCVMFSHYDQTVFIMSLTLINLVVGEAWGCMSGNAVNDISMVIGLIALHYYTIVLLRNMSSEGFAVYKYGYAGIFALITLAGCAFTLFVVPDSLEFDFSKDVQVFQVQLKTILSKAIPKSSADFSWLSDSKVELFFKLFICIHCTLISFVSAYPSLRIVRAHYELINTQRTTNEKNSFTKSLKFSALKLCSYVNLVSPIFVSLLWIPSVWKPEEIPKDYKFPSASLESFRTLIVMFLGICHVVPFYEYARMYCLSGFKKAQGSISNLNQESCKKFQLIFRSIYSLIPSVMLDLLCPFLFTALLSMLLKRKRDLELGICSVLFGSSSLPRSLEISPSLFNNALLPSFLEYLLWWHHISLSLQHLISLVIVRYLE